MHRDADQVWSPDGSGGDGGRDVLVLENENTIIYQLKYFTDGLTSKPESRKRQITDSFTAALKHNPDEWVLVFPSKINESMSKFLTLLPSRKAVKDIVHNKNVKIRFLDRPRLDALLASHPDLLNLVEREDDYVLRAAQILNQEKSVMTEGVSDLQSRVANLGELVDGVDPYWTLDFRYGPKGTVVKPIAKHPNSATLSPIKQDFTLRFPADEADLVNQTESIFGYGARGSLKIPGEYVHVGHYEGPEFFRWEGTIDSLSLIAEKGNQNVQGKPIRLVVLDEEGELLADDEGSVTYGANGIKGHSLEISMFGRVCIALQIPWSKDMPVKMSVTQRANGVRPAEVRDGAAVLCAIGKADTIELYFEGERILKFGSPEIQASADIIADLEVLRQTADDLSIVQGVLKQSFPMPEIMQPLERIWLRSLRIVLEGGVAPIPRKSVKIDLRHDIDTNEFETNSRHSVYWLSDKGSIARLAGRDLRLPVLAYAHPMVEHSIDVETKTAYITPVNDEVFAVYAPSLLRDKTGEVTPWNMPDITEPFVSKLKFSAG